jgi:ComF family protein
MIKTSFEAVKNIIFPNLCFACESKTPNKYLCAPCQQQIEYLTPPLCRRCSAPLKNTSTEICKNCFDTPFSYNKAIAAVAYKNPVISLIHSFKYNHCKYLSGFLSSLITAHFSKIGLSVNEFDFLTTVPMHREKLKMRGFNQSELLGQCLSNHFKKPFKNDIIYRKRFNPSQTKFRKEKREKNTEKMFEVKKDLKGKKIIIVDDIFTTGATVNACAKELKNNNAQNVLVVTLAKAQ